MSTFLEFTRAAAPWVVIGLWVAITLVQKNNQDNNKENSVLFKILQILPYFGFVLVAALEYTDGKTGSATTFLVLAIVLGLFSIKKKNEKTEK